MITLLYCTHEGVENDDKMEKACLRLTDEIDTASAKKGLDARYRFMNYGYKGQKILEGYGEENVEKLKAVSQKYDPDGFFQTAVPGGFKLWHSD